METFKYVWLNLSTGEFSNSWDQAEHDQFITKKDILKNWPSEEWKLIKYSCVNDEDFEFMNKMKLK